MNDSSLESWDDARVFLAVAETGSFGRAARLLGIAQPTVSRRIADFEFRVGQTLFHRGRRGATLTEAGARLLPAAQNMARWATELERTVQSQNETPEGLVRLAAPPAVAFDFLVAFCATLRTTYPKLRIELLSGIEYLDLQRGEADLALRLKPPSESGLVLLHTLRAHAAPYATPDYRDQLGPDPSITDVDWICWSSTYRHVRPNPDLEALIPNFAPAFASDSSLVQLRACTQGLGAMFLSAIEHPYLEDRGLVPLKLRDFPELPTTETYLVCPRSVEHVTRVRVVIKALIRELKRTTCSVL